MRKTVDGVYKIKDSILTSNFTRFHDEINELWRIKKKFSKKITNRAIDSLYSKLKTLGVKSGKLSGAGGGGFMYLFVDFDKKKILKDYLDKRGITIYNVYLTNDSVQSHTSKESI